ncbi:Zn-ribbon domain-containing OB-fold protein [Nocardioides halotolerans]|uniref:Zn-ribbon domain-containing OB-fold protein n=1 Tax=Nocardioides halotolerans TaxID=433660 RepID=UPI0006867A95|nr:OB-fold domain-containing protein [Nocardioides halotolerans]
MNAELAALDGPRPDRRDPEIRHFWDGLTERELRAQVCADCQGVQWPPRAACVKCQSLQLTWHVIAGSGTLSTWTEVHRTGLAGYQDLVPYAVGIVEIDETPVRMVGYIHTPDIDTLVAGERLVVRFAERGEGVVLPVWHRESEGA